ncbi:Gfo/Idh/MocA family protein [Nonomuraea rubra]|uniref:Putative dehydrogenase n=1 Tax=Nonomuraea rubra TaxID=46180 RepID=A0A7X0P0P5_9ACTN|nr:Gfo/Idh/MocA family oxidoreductase [Nonomuraea rubra]MBB6553057.1 putative dehydrogenase [Nonomuraea rubra]
MSVTLAIVGAGARGQIYARAAAADGRARIVAVADPDPARRNALADEHGLPEDARFAGWAELAAAPKRADAVVIATQDRMHAEPAVAFAELGYAILLEKPMAPTEREARRIVEAVERSGVVLAVCHVLRYTAYTRAFKELVGGGRLGTISSVQHLEPVGWWHMAHSFVRGSWRNAAGSGPMLLTKSCHDLDWLLHLVQDEPVSVASFGSLTHFRPENRPPGAGGRCVGCAVEPTCPYSAQRLYLGCLGDPDREFWPLGPVTSDATVAGVIHALETGPYGRCVYDCDNDVVDQQVVMLEFARGTTVSFTMTAFTPLEHRKTRVFGTHGFAEGDGRTIRVVDFTTGAEESIDTGTMAGASLADGHGGGDVGLIRAFIDAVEAGDQAPLGAGAADALAGHLVVWAAERARERRTVEAL